MNSQNSKATYFENQSGMTLVELLVALAIGSFLMIAAVQVYNQSRQAFIINESIARVQETAQFAMDTIEADLRMASNWGRLSRGLAIEGRSLLGNANPNGLAEPAACGAQDRVHRTAAFLSPAASIHRTTMCASSMFERHRKHNCSLRWMLSGVAGRSDG